MKLKLRFKKALFAFFKDEILDAIDDKNQYKQVVIERKTLDFVELRMNVDLQEQRRRIGDPEPLITMSEAYERAVRIAREQLFEEAIKYIKIQNSSVTDVNIYEKRIIRASLFVGITNL